MRKLDLFKLGKASTTICDTKSQYHALFLLINLVIGMLLNHAVQVRRLDFNGWLFRYDMEA